MTRFRSMNLRPMQLLLLFFVAVVFAIALAGCATTAKLNTDPVAQAALSALVDVAVGEAVQKGVQPARLVEIAAELEAFDTGQSVTIPALTAEIQALVVKASLNEGETAAVSILVSTLDAVISQQMQAGSSAPTGPLSATSITTINIVLSDVVAAAQIYSGQPAAPPATTDVPPQNKHFVLASIESPAVVGAAASLVLVASLQAFAHVSVTSPVAAAITVLFTVGSAAIANLIS